MLATSLLALLASLLSVNAAVVFEPAATDSSSSALVSSAQDPPIRSLANCPRIAPRGGGPTSVRDVRVDEVKAFASLGDSITAAFGVTPDKTDPLHLLYEDRGLSWSSGADEDAVSVFNFIKTFQPSLVGGSVGRHFTELCYGPLCPPLQYHPHKDVFNAAQSGSLAANLYHQVTYLVKQLKQRTDINFEKDYKVVNILIGANDLCLACTGFLTGSYTSPDAFEKYIRKAVEAVRAQVPRVIVSAVELFNVSSVYDLSKKSSYCSTVHRVFPVECACAFSEGAVGRKTRATMSAYAQEYNARLRKIAQEYMSDTKRSDRDSFAMVTQPVGRDTHIEDFPIEFLSKLDCFHPSRLGQAEIAVAVWNNLITPVESKATEFNVGEDPKCPSADTRIFV